MITTINDKIVSYAGNGITTVFSTDNGTEKFKVFKKTATTHTLIVKTVVVATGVETTLVENTDYTVALTGTEPSLANVTITTPPATGTNVFLISNIEKTQTTNFSGELNLADINSALDKLTLIAQEIDSGQTDLAIQVSETSGLSGITAPAAVADGIWKWNAAAGALETKTIDELVSTTAFDLSALSASTTLSGTNDHLAFYDVSGAGQFKATITNVVDAGIAGFSTITETDTANDKLVIQDATDGTTKLVTPDNLGISSGFAGEPVGMKSSAIVTAEQSITPAVDTWIDVTGLSLTHAASTETGKLHIMATLHFSCDSATAAVYARIVKDGVIADHNGNPDYDEAAAMTSEDPDTHISALTVTSFGTIGTVLQATVQPGLATSTYKVQVATDTASTTIKINNDGRTNTNAYAITTASQMHIIEYK